MALLTLAEAKAQLNITTTTSDTELQAYIEAITSAIEGIVGPVENRTVVELVEARGPTMTLLQAPVVSLTSFVPVLDGGTALDVTGLYLYGAIGEVRRKNGSSFCGGPWTATYTAGRGTVPPTINLAARILLQHLWRTQYGSARGVAASADDFDVNEPVIGYGYAIPNRVLQLLEPFKTGPGVA
ncbi:head-tail connector protein [Streptomyces filamentosus]|uniref:head-tail connector protein n=1 Tax=Streptomyces filamentosus TaxID=67294 RepID=UPI0012388A82|nr:head-tail connector protein [Streptomyces filamentosus]KAA6211772.1 phage gp6-like head-tail connector protein [Streptomyces filamentosus]KAA6220010.1 phage gp6-like head-tail connector protein [Streptomyces filamentosus]KAA6220062.1 phage gp6-like head-tail connector protein [Streptomyces filamentosus]